MYRQRSRVQVRYGHFNDILRIVEEINALARSRGWREATFWTQSFGRTNEFVIEIDFPDLETLERETKAYQNDAEAMRLWRSTAEHVVEGSGYEELLETAPHLA